MAEQEAPIPGFWYWAECSTGHYIPALCRGAERTDRGDLDIVWQAMAPDGMDKPTAFKSWYLIPPAPPVLAAIQAAAEKAQ